MSEFEYYADYELQWSPDVAQASALEVGATSEVVSQAVVSLALRGAAAAGSSVSRVQVSSLPSAKFGSARRVESSLSVLQMKGMPSLTTQDLSRAGLGAFVPSDPQTGRARHAALVSHLTSRLLGAGWTALGGSDAGSVSEGDTVVLVHALALGDLRPVVSIRLQQCPHGMHVRLHGGAVAGRGGSRVGTGEPPSASARVRPPLPRASEGARDGTRTACRCACCCSCGGRICRGRSVGAGASQRGLPRPLPPTAAAG
jgi:hypothetical protein